MGNHELFGTTTLGLNIHGMVILAADGRVSRLDGTVARDNYVKLEWVMDSIFVTNSGGVFYASKIVENIRNMCKNSPPSTVEAVVDLFVQESNKELSALLKDPGFNAIRHNWSLTIGGRLHVETCCKLFQVAKITGQQLFASASGKLFTNNSLRKEFFTTEVKKKLLEAKKGYDRALLSEIVKSYIAYSSSKDQSTGGRVTMVTIDDRGFHLFESADLIDPNVPLEGYKESKFDEFYPVGYLTG